MRRAAGVACAMALVAALAGACTDDENGPANDPIGTKDDPVQLSFMTYGPDDEAAAYEKVVQEFNDSQDGIVVKLHSVPTRNDALKALRAGVNPDVFLLSRGDLAEVVRDGRNQPVDEPVSYTHLRAHET